MCIGIASPFFLFSILFNYFFSNSLAAVAVAAAACTMPFRMCSGKNVHTQHKMCNEHKRDGQKIKKKGFFYRVLTDFVLFTFFTETYSLCSLYRAHPHANAKFVSSVQLQLQLLLLPLLLLRTLTCMYEHCHVFKLHFKLHSILYLNLQDFWAHANVVVVLVVLCN